MIQTRAFAWFAFAAAVASLAQGHAPARVLAESTPLAQLTHTMGRLVPDGRRVSAFRRIEVRPSPAELGPPRFVVLHFQSVQLSRAAKLTIDLGYGQDVFGADAGSDFWTRPVDAARGPVKLHITGGLGSAQLTEYMVFEATVSPGHHPGDELGNLTSPDAFLYDDPYAEPIYESRLMCDGAFDWRNSSCEVGGGINDVARWRVPTAVGFIVMIHDGYPNSCTGTLIGEDLFLTARHCLRDDSEVQSASVTFDYATLCDGHRPANHSTVFHKVIAEAAGEGGVFVDQDWVVVRLDKRAGLLPLPVPLRSSAPAQGEPAMIVHHPNGAAKKLQAGTFDAAIGCLQGADYAGGSSGSATFDAQGRLITGPLSSGQRCRVSYAALDRVREQTADLLRISIRNATGSASTVRIYPTGDVVSFEPLPGGVFDLQSGETGYFTLPEPVMEAIVVLDGVDQRFAVIGSEIVFDAVNE